MEHSKSLFEESFFKDDFSIDNYLSQCTQKTDLMTLRQDLKNYGNILYSQMMEILKEETEDIVNLAENLTGLKSKIDDLSSPVSQLSEEIRSLYVSIDEVKRNFGNQLAAVQAIDEKQDHLNLKLGLLAASSYIDHILNIENIEEDITVLERAVNEYSFQHQYLCELNFESDLTNDEVTKSVKKLAEVVNKLFLKVVRRGDEDMIVRCLRMYINLNKEPEAEEFLRKDFIRPALNPIFTQRNLDQNGQQLKPLLGRALDFLKNDMKFFVNLQEKHPDIKNFNFVIRSYWKEVDEQLSNNLPNLTAPGNPDLFHKRFQDTWNFYNELINITRDKQLLSKDVTFSNHLKRFNLPVYFEIRFQQIAGDFESEALATLNDLEFLENNTVGNNFKLKISLALWKGVKRTLCQEVFIVHIADQFFKLVLMLVSRMMKWIDDCIKIEDTDEIKMEEFLINILHDFQILEQLIGPANIKSDEFDAVSEKLDLYFQKILQFNLNNINTKRVMVREELAKIKTNKCVSSLQQVTSIPRLYRRTNRSIPKDPSGYILEVTSTLTQFHSKYNKSMENELRIILDLVVSETSKQYLNLVEEVLKLVCKTEESLRRLKSRNTTFSDESSQSTSDEAKIREQIKLDVTHFIDEVKRILPSTMTEDMKKLKEICI